jgi:(1->4)-alpha-D-glucan 1-alpha-D-glucosylmutase
MTDFRCAYRLQLRPHLDFDGARDLVPYLRDLGVSHLYLAPSMQARSSSTHGYDVADPTRLDDALGGETAFRSLCRAGLGVILDVVPNHMAAGDENPFWRDPVTRGRFFDVDWRTGNPRRFFDIDDLVGVRVEDPDVFETTHAKVIELVREGLLSAIRIDHPDGLANPARYFERLREAGIERVWAEKILEPGEQLRDWPILGTTGYEFANDVTALFVEPEAEESLTTLYRKLTGEGRQFEEVAFDAKVEQASTTFAREVEWLRGRLGGVEKFDLPRALSSLSIYRTYVEPETGKVEALDREAIREAHLPAQLAELLLLEESGHDAFVTRFQQTTPAVMAKGVEDTAFYRYNRLVALNEVGGDPGRFSLPVEDFHERNLERAQWFPQQLLTTQTHDTKRSGDVRARLGALSWFAEDWRDLVLSWSRLNAPLRRGGTPDANEEYLIYQTLVGAWPIEPERLDAYLEKALREAKVNTNWLEPNEEWEAGVKEFARRLIDHEPFVETFRPFAAEVARAGLRVSLAQTLLKLTCPGVPDIYQGDELWTLNLVDPDNRRPVDWALRRRLLDGIIGGSPPREESAKLALIWRTLQLRARRPEAFAGPYEPVESGPDVCAFIRGDEILVAVPLRPAARFRPPAGYRNVLEGVALGIWLLERE